MWTAVLTVLAIASMALHLRAEYLGPQWQVYLFKPLTTVLILLMTAQVRRPVSTRYKALILAGLVFSLAGDVFLMLPSDLFIAGLVSFLIAHLLYIAAFWAERRSGLTWWPLVPLAAFGILIFAFLAPYLGPMKLPVAAYVVVILAMAWQAWEWWAGVRQPGTLLAAVGATLFVLSDTALAVDRFRAPFAASTAVVMITYVAAQWGIGRSVERAGR